MFKNKLFTVLVLVLLSSAAFSQPYQTGLGFRLGSISSGISVRHFVSGNSAFEGIASFGNHTFILTGLYEKFYPFPNAEGLSWFWGFGAHAGFHQHDYPYDYFYHKHHKHDHDDDDHDHDFSDNHFSFGGDFIIGLDYKIKNAPIDLSLDVKPMIDFVPGFYGYWEGALSFRFTL